MKQEWLEKSQIMTELPTMVENVGYGYEAAKRKNEGKDIVSNKRNKISVDRGEKFNIFKEIKIEEILSNVAPIDEERLLNIGETQYVEEIYGLGSQESEEDQLRRKEYEEICQKMPFHTNKLSYQEKKQRFPSSCRLENWKKNRYTDILCNEDTRYRYTKKNNMMNLCIPNISSLNIFSSIKLTSFGSELPSVEQGDRYINANYVRGSNKDHTVYIATQAPLESTMLDFYDMLWESNTKVVVSLCSLVENSKAKCHSFWPDYENPINFAHYCISLKHQQVYREAGEPSIFVRTIRVFNFSCNTTREIVQIHTTAWPDKGVPRNNQLILDIYNLQKKYQKEGLQQSLDGPVCVHCSAGIGRTATYISFALSAQALESERLPENPFLVDFAELIKKKLDIPQLVLSMRQQRHGSVQTCQQYLFIYKALEYFLSKLYQR